jgi:2-polyprenyl-6-methoxyphenol hydroxylase-like FAD-dependent oxidoreductase
MKVGRAIVAGGGIGGLSTALALRKVGIDAVVLERAPGLRAAGCGVHLWTNAVLALADLGLADALHAIAPSQTRCEFRTWRGKQLARWPVSGFAQRYGQPVVAIGRDDLIDIFADAVGPAAVRGDAEVVSYAQDADGVTVHLSDGSIERGDVLIGADGINSAVRRQLLGSRPPDYTGYVAWRAAADLDHPLIEPDFFRCMFGRGTRFVFYAIAPGRVHWMSVANAPAGGRDGADPRPDLLARHEGWMEPVADIINATAAEAIIRTDVVDRRPDPVWGLGRVTLLGDAAHPMNFNVGQGACQAVEDALVLAQSLAAAASVPAGLRAYEAARQPRTAAMQRTARVIGRIGAWHNPAAVALRSTIFRLAWNGPVFRRLEQEVAAGARWSGAPSASTVDGDGSAAGGAASAA